MTLITPLNWSKIRFPILYLPKEISGTKENVAQSQRLHGTNTSIRGKSQFSSSRQGSLGQSPFPCLDRFVADVLALRGGTAGEVRGWFVEKMQHSETKVPAGHGANRSEMSTLQSITYQMLRNRWCENVGREHKSNNVMWTIDLISLEYWQSCHDPDCKAVGFRGKRMALPKDVVSKLRENLLDISLAQVDESVLLKVAAQTQTEVQRPLADDEDFERALLQLDISGQL